MEGSFGDKYAFVGEWYDNHASLVRRFNIFFYPTDDTIEMYDVKFRRTFLHRVKVNGVTIDNFILGCTVNILGRLVKIVDFGCEDTRKRLQKDLETTFIMIKPVPTRIAGKIITHFYEHGYRISKMKKARLNSEDVALIYRDLHADPTYPFLMEHLTGQSVYGLELVGKNVSTRIFEILGNRDPALAEPNTIRKLYGTDRVKNCVHVSSSAEAAKQDIEYFFPAAATMRLRLTATLSNCTLCIVKPHAVREGRLGRALEAIDEGGFEVTALNMFMVENVNAGEFYEVYKGIVQEYKGMVDELASGPCVAMEIVSKDKNLNSAVEFRKLVGPSDPEIARLLRPHTMRAKLGNTKVQNAIHCSDLPEDGLLEVEYFFKILDF